MQNYLITGASSGIGLALCEKMLSCGAKVYAVSRSQGGLALITHPHLIYIAADITQADGRHSIVNALPESIQLNFINNAAFAEPEIFAKNDFTNLEQHFKTNFFAPLALIQALHQKVQLTRILNISSGAAQHPLPSLLGYCTSKAAIHHAMKCLNLEYPQTLCANVRPGMVATPLQERWRQYKEDIFPHGNPYLAAYTRGELVAPQTVVDFIMWIMQLPDKQYCQDWNIFDREHQANWLQTSSVYAASHES